MQYVGFRVHYKDVSCIKYRQDIFMSWDTLFSSFGGIFGLCLGGSVISIIEFIYYYTYKLFYYYYSVDGGNSAKVCQDPGERRRRRRQPELPFASNGINLGRNERTMKLNVAKQFLDNNNQQKYGHEKR